MRSVVLWFLGKGEASGNSNWDILIDKGEGGNGRCGSVTFSLIDFSWSIEGDD